jgi:hypothetical protein
MLSPPEQFCPAGWPSAPISSLQTQLPQQPRRILPDRQLNFRQGFGATRAGRQQSSSFPPCQQLLPPQERQDQHARAAVERTQAAWLGPLRRDFQQAGLALNCAGGCAQFGTVRGEFGHIISALFSASEHGFESASPPQTNVQLRLLRDASPPLQFESISLGLCTNHSSVL